MRVAFTVRIPESLHKKLRVQSAERGLSLQDATESAVVHWLESKAPAVAGHGADCPLARASREESELLNRVLELARESADLRAFLRAAASGFKRFR